MLDGVEAEVTIGKTAKANFMGSERQVEVCELVFEAKVKKPTGKR
jgi:hypothetical protein